MRAFGRVLGSLLRAGDLVMLTGPLGAGKTTMTQGIAEGMDVTGRVASPTFVIAQVHHPRLGAGADLVHVDAYRLESLEELDALDLDTSLEESATVVEWGEGKVEVLADDRLTITITRPSGMALDDEASELSPDAPRTLQLSATGARARQIIEQIRTLIPGADGVRTVSEDAMSGGDYPDEPKPSGADSFRSERGN
ncbi:MAG: tRNA (adenosine(37)-N6)-threonylcarbamoyltransferase complex ATPase subunit type 1 TsaE [Actinomycetaceae bacterium]|nr:tRNA (adenosine(37)-N6)-threonylcarbamoyltransferase complex ATPase subunit type 1 TsaE [Actinomycetaceae bacterium]MDY6082873.1 tRNA (adenosine(37)-N6)-threonylcarbamoyltransferase complex ATPase subunit type 1 TsaE [Actinomycetaceae bacterium]